MTTRAALLALLLSTGCAQTVTATTGTPAADAADDAAVADITVRDSSVADITVRDSALADITVRDSALADVTVTDATATDADALACSRPDVPIERIPRRGAVRFANFTHNLGPVRFALEPVPGYRIDAVLAEGTVSPVFEVPLTRVTVTATAATDAEVGVRADTIPDALLDAGARGLFCASSPTLTAPSGCVEAYPSFVLMWVAAGNPLAPSGSPDRPALHPSPDALGLTSGCDTAAVRFISWAPSNGRLAIANGSRRLPVLAEPRIASGLALTAPGPLDLEVRELETDTRRFVGRAGSLTGGRNATVHLWPDERPGGLRAVVVESTPPWFR